MKVFILSGRPCVSKRVLPGLISMAHVHTHSQTPCCRASIWMVTSYSTQSIRIKIIVGMKIYLVTNNGELLIVSNIERNGSLWSNVFFEKALIFHSNMKRLPEVFYNFLMHQKAQYFVHQGCNFDDRLSPNFDRFVILCICWDAPSEKTDLWQLLKVSSAFTNYLN